MEEANVLLGAQTLDEYRWNRLALRRFEHQITKAFEALRRNRIEPILIKGWAAARFYPEDRPRSFSDIDLAVSAENYELAFELSHSNELGNLNIDIHRELRSLDRVDWTTLFERSKLLPLDNTTVRILSPEDHLRVLCTHWLTDGGQYRERLWDIYYAIQNRPENFDWNLCLGSVSPTRRRWIVTVIAITRKHLGLEIKDLPFFHETEHIEDWIEKCLEKEWRSNVRLRSLHTCINDPKLLIKQIRKRLPPNPIQATIEAEGELDGGTRLPYQLKSVFRRLKPSISRVAPTLAERIWSKTRR